MARIMRSSMTHIHTFPNGLTAVTGGERSGKTHFLRALCGELPPALGAVPQADAVWLDLALPAHDAHLPHQVWEALRTRCVQWNETLHNELIDALKLRDHLDKKLFMLSAGSRRKVALVGLLSSGAAITCLDQPYAALDQASIRVVSAFLNDMAEHPSRSWVVADYEADRQLPWRQVIALDGA